MKVRRGLAGCLLTVLAATAQAQVKWDLPTAYPPTNHHTANIVQFAADVESATGGKLKITVHANAALFKAPEIKRAVQGGQAEIGEILWVNYESEDPLFGIDGVPFLATGYGEAFKLWQASRQALEARLVKQGMRVLYSVPWPPQGIYSKRPLSSIADMKGLKWRAYSPTTARIADLVGAQPVTIQASEIQVALATGVMDSMMTSSATGLETKAFEHVKNFYDTRAWLPKNAVIVNQRAFDALDRGMQSVVLKAAAEAETRGWKMSEEKTNWYLDQLKQHGMAIHQPSAELRAGLKKVGDQILADWLKKAGTDGAAVIDAYRKL